MGQPHEADTAYDVVCPHCNKRFEAPLLSGDSDRHQGFKCPHCRLFVDFARAEEQDRIEPQSS
jgi:phage FluMu protein Com